MRKVLIIAYFFPPLGGAGVQRTLKFVKYLPFEGFEPVVLTVKNPSYDAFDERLLSEIDSKIKIFKAHSFEPGRLYNILKKIIPWKKPKSSGTSGVYRPGLLNRIYNFIFIPDDKIFWGFFAFLKGFGIVKREKTEILYSTSMPYSSHIAGLLLKKFTGLPWVADFRDPWASNTYARPSTRLHDLINKKLEKLVVKNADAVISVTAPIVADFKRNYPRYSRKFHLITNGFDPADFENIARRAENEFSVTHVGTIYGETRNPSGFIAAFDDFLSTEGVNPELCRAVFAGNIDRFNLGVIEEKKNTLKHKNCLVQLPYISHEECVKLLYSSSVLLLIEGEAKSLTGKIFEYLASGRPILALAAENSPVSLLIRETASGEVVELNDIAKIRGRLLKYYKDFKNSGLPGNTNSSLIGKFSRKELTKQLAEIFNSLKGGSDG
ncbi:MAG: glycosyltransferase [Candidatus Firestonebacteria bacterium]